MANSKTTKLLSATNAKDPEDDVGMRNERMRNGVALDDRQGNESRSRSKIVKVILWITVECGNENKNVVAHPFLATGTSMVASRPPPRPAPTGLGLVGI